MPRLKKATDANGNVFYPITIAKGVYDTDNNLRLSSTLADLYNGTQDAINAAAMFMLANFSGLPIKINNVEYKYVLTDPEDHVLLGKKQDDTWYFGDETDDLMDDILDQYVQDDTIFSNMYRLAVAISLVKPSAVNTTINNVEWKWVILDSQDHILMGVRQDNSWYLGVTITEIMNAAITTYAATCASVSGTWANKPTSPNVGQMYFCTDKIATGGSNYGIPIWYKGNNTWVDAVGNTVS